MKIKWLGHASFLITADSGTKIITDPYTTGGPLSYGEIKESADIVTMSHQHGDHNNAASVRGNPRIIKEPGAVEVEGVKITGTPAFHDDVGGAKRGTDIIFCFGIDGMKVCHLGDLGHPLGDKELKEIGKVDVVMAPVGGYYTMDAKGIAEVCNKLAAKVIIPMHFKTEKCTYPIATADEFLQGKKGVIKQNTSEVELKKDKLPATTEIVVLKPAL